MSFAALGLAEPIIRALKQERYFQPTPIQASAIPAILTGRDLIGIAQTGTGKTAAFALPILSRMMARPPVNEKCCRALVLTPTRELANQVADAFRAYGRNTKRTVSAVIGGVAMGRQIAALARGVDVLVATPGRLLDLIQARKVCFDEVEWLVLDEADRMLDMGFVRDVRRIVALLPSRRQSLLFSATMPKAIAALAQEMLSDPVTVSVSPPSTTVELVAQRVVHVARDQKPRQLACLLESEAVDRAIVFTRTKHRADRVARDLGLDAQAIHGNKSQTQRERTLEAFRAGRIRILVATDIAARGIDVDGVSHVVNYDLPSTPEAYVHRIGRTARAGSSGIAISLCEPEDAASLRAIERSIKQQIPTEDAIITTAQAKRTSAPASRRHKRTRGPVQASRFGTAISEQTAATGPG